MPDSYQFHGHQSRARAGQASQPAGPPATPERKPMSGLNPNAPNGSPPAANQASQPAGPPATPESDDRSDMRIAHDIAADALINLFKTHRVDESKHVTAKRANQVLQALATFSAHVALNEIKTHLPPPRGPLSSPPDPQPPLPPNAEP